MDAQTCVSKCSHRHFWGNHQNRCKKHVAVYETSQGHMPVLIWPSHPHHTGFIGSTNSWAWKISHWQTPVTPALLPQQQQQPPHRRANKKGNPGTGDAMSRKESKESGEASWESWWIVSNVDHKPDVSCVCTRNWMGKSLVLFQSTYPVAGEPGS